MRNQSQSPGLTPVALALTVVGMTACGVSMTSSPLPKGHVEIQVTFEGLSRDDYDKLTGFVQKLPKNYQTGHYRDFSTSFGSSGFVNQRYKPKHPVPSSKVEKDIQDRLETFLRDNELDAGSVKLQLLYGQEETPSRPTQTGS